MKIVVYWENSDEESTAKKAARYLLSMFKKRGMPKAEILVRSVGAGLADEAQRLADQMEAAFGEGKSPLDMLSTYEDEVRVLASQTATPTIVFGTPADRSGWTLADVHAMRDAHRTIQGGGQVRSAVSSWGGRLLSAVPPDEWPSADLIKEKLEKMGFHDLGESVDGFITASEDVK